MDNAQLLSNRAPAPTRFCTVTSLVEGANFNLTLIKFDSPASFHSHTQLRESVTTRKKSSFKFEKASSPNSTDVFWQVFRPSNVIDLWLMNLVFDAGFFWCSEINENKQVPPFTLVFLIRLIWNGNYNIFFCKHAILTKFWLSFPDIELTWIKWWNLVHDIKSQAMTS